MQFERLLASPGVIAESHDIGTRISYRLVCVARDSESPISRILTVYDRDIDAPAGAQRWQK